MKTFIYIFLFAIMARPIFPFLEYVVNYEHIAKDLCENRNKPQQECNGKCHLKKELAKASEDGQPSSQEKKSQPNEIIMLFMEDLHTFTFNTIKKLDIKINTLYTNLYAHLDTVLIFHPPCHPTFLDKK